MKNFWRMFVLVVAFFAAGFAFATSVPVTMYSAAAATGWQDSGAGACSAFTVWEKANQPDNASYSGGYTFTAPNRCTAIKVPSYSTPLTIASRCPYSTPAGASPVNGICSDSAPPPKCTVSYYNITVKMAANGKFPDHDALCTYQVSMQIRCWVKGGTSDTYCSYYGGTDGTAYTPLTNPTTPVAPDPVTMPIDTTKDIPTTVPPTPAPPGGNCPKGTVVGGTDSSGTPICMGTGTNTDVTKPVTTTAPPVVTTDSTTGAKTQVDVTKQTNADGSVSTTTVTTVTASDGAKTVSGSTTTGNTAAGAPGVKSSAGDDQSKNDLCSQHPELNVCKNSQVNGACATVACTGDAIQCAILQSTAKANCAVAQDMTDTAAKGYKTLGDQLIGGNDPQAGAISTAMAGTDVDLSSQALDASGFVGGGSCIAPKVFHVAGHSVTADFSTLCANIQPLRYVILAAAYIVAYLLVSKSVLQG